MIRKILYISLWVLLISGMFVTLGFVNKEQANVKCKTVNIKIDAKDENYFITQEDIIDLAASKGFVLKGQSTKEIDVNKLERIFNNHPSVANAEVYIDINGDVSIEIEQRMPIVRIITKKGESYYIDTDGKLMPLSENHTARVPIVTGNLLESYGKWYKLDFSGKTYWRKFKSHNYSNWHKMTKKQQVINDSLLKNTLLDDVYLLAKSIAESEFWTAQIEQIDIDDEIVLIPKVGNHKIIFGDATDIDEKLKKLFIFYRDGLSKVGWNEYSEINLKYKNQVVCKKNTTENE